MSKASADLSEASKESKEIGRIVRAAVKSLKLVQRAPMYVLTVILMYSIYRLTIHNHITTKVHRDKSMSPDLAV